MSKLAMMLGAAAVAACLPARGAEWSATATGGGKQVVSWEYADDAHKRVRYVVTHTFTDASEAATLTFHKAATVDVLVVGGGGGGCGYFGVVMPDHFHGILRVSRRLPRPLGSVVAAFM